MLDQDSHVMRLYRRAMMMLGIGKITGTTSDDGKAQTLQYQTSLEIRGNTPRMAEFGFSSGLPPETDVFIAFLGGDRSSPVIVASNNQTYRHTGLNPGETVIYNQWGMYVKLTESGIIVEAQNKPVTVSNSTIVTITGTDEIVADTPVLKCTGDILDNCNTNTSTLKQLRDAHNEHDHKLENVQSGSSTLTTKSTEDIV